MFFVELAPMLRQMGKDQIPARVTQSGYNPVKHRQVAVFGPVDELAVYIKQQGLNPDDYPIHESKMGPHIDIYGADAIQSLIPPHAIIDTMTFVRNQRR